MTEARVFPGQGSLKVGIGKELRAYRAALDIYEKADKVLGYEVLESIADEEKLKRTDLLQPAILEVIVACIAVAREKGIIGAYPAYGAGHSLGEYAAFADAEAISLEDCFRLVKVRGDSMFKAHQVSPGLTAYVILSKSFNADDLQYICYETGVQIAGENSPEQLTISGGTDSVIRAIDMISNSGAKKVGIIEGAPGAFHSDLMRIAKEIMAEKIEKFEISDPKFPIIGNVEAKPILTKSEVKKEAVEQICSMIKWAPSVNYMVDHGVDLFIEIGPSSVVSNLIERTIGKGKVEIIRITPKSLTEPKT